MKKTILKTKISIEKSEIFIKVSASSHLQYADFTNIYEDNRALYRCRVRKVMNIAFYDNCGHSSCILKYPNSRSVISYRLVTTRNLKPYQ